MQNAIWNVLCSDFVINLVRKKWEENEPGGKYMIFSCGSIVRSNSCRWISTEMLIAMLHIANAYTQLNHDTNMTPIKYYNDVDNNNNNNI